MISFRYISASFELQVFARVSEAESKKVVLKILGDGIGWFSFDPSVAVFRYQDPRESDPPEIRARVESKAICALSAALSIPDGNADVWLYEWREEKS